MPVSSRRPSSPFRHHFVKAAASIQRVIAINVISIDKGCGDGLRLDVDGNLWCGWAGGDGLDGVMIFNSAGAPIGRIDLPKCCANVCFGGYRKSRLSWRRADRSMRSG
jgi:sugar lactone lactonase YvrE